MKQTAPRERFATAATAAACCALACWLAASPSTASELRRTAIVKAVERAQPAVVDIRGEKTMAQDGHFGPGEPRRVNGMGTGIVIDERGYILTNYHVVEGVEKILVTEHTGRSHIAQLLAHDRAADLAIIKINGAKSLSVIDIGTSRDLMLGEPVVAVGNPFGYEHTVTRGIISALNRKVQVTDTQVYDDLIQTDASINPGNSGGPLLNIDGELIGVAVAVRAGAQGIGFAIPVDKAMTVAAELLRNRRRDALWHGVVPNDESTERGLVLDAVRHGSPAAELELRAGDVITAVEDLPVARPFDFERALLERRSGEEVMLSVRREGKQLEMPLVLAKQPRLPDRNDDPIWQVLGVRLQPIAPETFRRYRTKYRGGLLVREVRPGGAAARHNIRRGDVLLGMHVWETVSLANVSYIINRADIDKFDRIKFYILRDNETLYGHLQVSGHQDR